MPGQHSQAQTLTVTMVDDYGGKTTEIKTQSHRDHINAFDAPLVVLHLHCMALFFSACKTTNKNNPNEVLSWRSDRASTPREFSDLSGGKVRVWQGRVADPCLLFSRDNVVTEESTMGSF